MRAVVMHGPKDYRLENVPIPKAGPGEVIVKIEHVGMFVMCVCGHCCDCEAFARATANATRVPHTFGKVANMATHVRLTTRHTPHATTYKNRTTDAQPPVICGHEFIGVVSELGHGAAETYGLKVGDRAVCRCAVGQNP